MASNDPFPTFSIPDDLCKKTGITANWINEDKISINAFNKILSTTRDVPTELSGRIPVKIFHLSTDFILDEPILRSLVTESSNIFIRLQNVKNQATDLDYLKISRSYRSTIRACLEKLQDLVTNEKLEFEEQYRNYITIFYSIECVWHLCEFLLIDQTSTNAVVPHLLEWVRFHFPASERMATELLQQGREIDNLRDYWPVVKGLILQGQVSVARALLKLHTSSENVCFQVAEQILEKMPIYSVYAGLSLQKFKSQWHYWSTNAEAKIQAGILAAEPELEEIIKLVIGDTSTWREQFRSSSCWYEFFPGFLFYTESGCKYYELGTFANNWLSQYMAVKENRHRETGFKFLDKIILSVMENNMHQVLHDIQNMCDNKWFVTHLADLLYHCGHLNISTGDQNNNAEKLFRESLLYDYGTTLMSRSSSLWECGLDYLEFSCTEGLGAREALLSRIPIKNEKQAMKLISVAKKNGFQNYETEICRVLVKRNLTNKRYGNALEWAVRSKDNIYVTGVANIFLEHYCNTGEIMCEDVIANIGAKMLISPRLIFLVKYYDFRQYYSERSFAQAAELLINLLDSKITPNYFWPSLLSDTIPLLEFKEPVIPSKETYTILSHLESDLIPMIEKRKMMQKEKVAVNKEDDENLALNVNLSTNLLNNCSDDLVKLIRLACARNLARAFIIEKTVT